MVVNELSIVDSAERQEQPGLYAGHRHIETVSITTDHKKVLWLCCESPSKVQSVSASRRMLIDEKEGALLRF